VPLFPKLRHAGRRNKRGNAIEPRLRAMPIIPLRRGKSGKTNKTNAGRAASELFWDLPM